MSDEEKKESLPIVVEDQSGQTESMCISKSTEVAELFSALAKVQAGISAMKKSGVNPHFGSSYSTMDDVRDASREAMGKHGIAIVQSPIMGGNAREVRLSTLVTHASGQWLESVSRTAIDKPTAQAVGSAVTYLRRYAFSAVLALASDDDDGNAATGKPPKTKRDGKDAPVSF